MRTTVEKKWVAIARGEICFFGTLGEAATMYGRLPLALYIPKKRKMPAENIANVYLIVTGCLYHLEGNPLGM